MFKLSEMYKKRSSALLSNNSKRDSSRESAGPQLNVSRDAPKRSKTPMHNNFYLQ